MDSNEGSSRRPAEERDRLMRMEYAAMLEMATPHYSSDDASDAEEEDPDTEDPESEPPEEDDFKMDLRDCLDGVKYQGTFSSSVTTGLYINPGLSIGTLGPVGLPLSVRDAMAIAGICKQSPFGRGDETVVDETVRKTWELGTTEFSCCNPAWEVYLDTLAQQAIQNLGVQVIATAQPYKLLLYEEGAFFKAHRDTEKVPGMFGTLVVSLPSEHTGGQVVLKHGGKERVLETAAPSAFDLSALAWYADVEHEIKPIMSGYRLVLTFNLVQDQMAPKQTAAALDANALYFEKLLRIWRNEFDYCDYFIYPLAHKYTASSLSLKNMKGRDAAKCRYLEQLCPKNDVYWFLAHMTKEKQDDYYEEEDDTDDLNISEPVTPQGKYMSLGPFYTDESQILADMEDFYDDRHPDSEDEGEYTGNENMPATFRYHDTVAIMMPKSGVLRAFGKTDHSAASLMVMFEVVRNDRHCSTDFKRSAFQTILKKCLVMVTYKEGQKDPPCHSVSKYLSYGGEERAKRRTEYAQTFETVSDFCYATNLGNVVAEVLRDTMVDPCWDESKDLVNLVARHIAKELAAGKQDVWSSWLSVPAPSVPTYKFANERRKTLEVIQRMLPPGSVASFEAWKRDQLHALIQSVTAYTIEDAKPIVELVTSTPSQVYFERIIPTLARRPCPAGLSRYLRLLSDLAARDKAMQKDVERPTYERLVAILASVIVIPRDGLAIQALKPRRECPNPPLHSTRTVNEFIDIVERCMSMGLKSEADELFAKGLPHLPPNGSNFWTGWQSVMVFIDLIIVYLLPYDDPALNNTASSFITKAIKSSASYLANNRPKPPADWSRPKSSRYPCACGPCNKVQSFLVNPMQHVGRFSYAERTRRHLEEKVGTQDCKLETERGPSGSSHTLVVYKTNNEYTRTLQKWKSEVADLRKKLVHLRSDSVTRLLGGDIEEVSGLDNALVAAGSAEGVAGVAQRALQPATASAQNIAHPLPSTAGVKRKAHVIDLTEDEPL